MTLSSSLTMSFQCPPQLSVLGRHLSVWGASPLARTGSFHNSKRPPLFRLFSKPLLLIPPTAGQHLLSTDRLPVDILFQYSESSLNISLMLGGISKLLFSRLHPSCLWPHDLSYIWSISLRSTVGKLATARFSDRRIDSHKTP